MCFTKIKELPRNTAIYTREQVANSKNLAIIGNQVYDIDEFSKVHPGGAMFPAFFATRDATIAFATYHGREWSGIFGNEFKVGELSKDEIIINISDEYLELRKLVDKSIGKNRGFAPPSYYIKVIFLLSSAIILEAYLMFHQRTFLLSTLMGLLFAMLGLNIMHDANHGAVSKNPTINRLLGLTQDWIGGSSVLWVHQHVVNHHIFANHEDLDPDIQGFPLFRLYQNSTWRSHHRFQHIYLFFAFTLFGVKIAFLDMFQLLKKEWSGSKLSPLAEHYWRVSVFLKLLFYLRFFVVPLVLCENRLFAMVHIFWTCAVCGAYLSFFFMLSHNFLECQTYSSNDGLDQGKKEYLRAVLETSSNVGGKFLCNMNGGLNYQIEHHLFPRLHHSYYPTIAPIVKKFCKEKELPYFHFPTIMDNVNSMCKYLEFLGRS